MKLKKLIIFQILSIIATTITFFLFYRDGFFIDFSLNFIKNNLQETLILTGLFISNLLISHSYIAIKAKNKKTNLKISLIILTTISIYFAYFRIKDAINYEFHILPLINLTIFICLVIINVKILKDLRKLIRKIIINKKTN